MRFRVGLAVGLGAGYVLGARAGRQRYEQIARTAKKVWESDAAAKARMELVHGLPDVVGTAAQKIGQMRHRNGDRDLMGADRMPS